MQSPFLIYRLLKSGEIKLIEPKNILDVFESVHIIAFYLFRVKRLYIWVGSEAPRDLKNLIPRIEEQVLKRNPSITILRHFTIEGFTNQTQEFLLYLKISEEEYKKQLDNWAKKQKLMIKRIEELEKQLNSLDSSRSPTEKKIIAQELLEQSNELNDLSRIQKYENLLLVIEEKRKGEEERIAEEKRKVEEERKAEEMKASKVEEVLNSTDYSLNDYLNILREANSSESTTKNHTLSLLTTCLNIIQRDKNAFLLKFPKRINDVKYLKNRISKLKENN
ncbi:MAG: hypothetical protein ACTSWC_12230 [Promethearchaeota archaeon]